MTQNHSIRCNAYYSSVPTSCSTRECLDAVTSVEAAQVISRVIEGAGETGEDFITPDVDSPDIRRIVSVGAELNTANGVSEFKIVASSGQVFQVSVKEVKSDLHLAAFDGDPHCGDMGAPVTPDRSRVTCQPCLRPLAEIKLPGSVGVINAA